MRPKNLAVVAALAIVLLMAGCGALPGRGPSSIDVAPKDVCTSNKGMQVFFEKGAPPREVNLNEEFYVSLKVENNGCSDTENAVLFITGFDTNKLQLTQTSFDGISLKGISPTSPYGEFQSYVTQAFAIGVDPAKEVDETVLNAVLCYDYTTTAQGEMCIAPPQESRTLEGVCTPGAVDIDPSQGGPVVVSGVKYRTIDSSQGRKIQMSIYVANRGEGKVIPPGSETCFGEPVVVLEDVTFGSYSTSTSGASSVKCFPSAITLSENSNNMFRCLAEITDSGPAFTTPLSITLRYGYVEARSMSVAIRNPEPLVEDTAQTADSSSLS